MYEEDEERWRFLCFDLLFFLLRLFFFFFFFFFDLDSEVGTELEYSDDEGLLRYLSAQRRALDDSSPRDVMSRAAFL